ncbi:MAG TPA: glycosyltransferase [Spirochaetia bacterium]|nr:glycosyltransferase [Spirochaetia bacterium]
MPAYNAEQFIDEAIKSILRQTYKNFELIIIDDCSTDKTLKVIKKFSLLDKRIKFDKNEKNQGIAVSRNKLVKHAKGKYIIWQDADDISITSRIEKQVKFMEHNTCVGICGGFLDCFNSKGKTGIRYYSKSDKHLRNNIFRMSPVAQPCSIIRSKIIKALGKYDITLSSAEDLDMSFRIGSVSKFANIQEVLLKYREHNQSNTYSQLSKQIKDTLNVRWRYRNSIGYSMNVLDLIFIFVSKIMQKFPNIIVISIFKIYKNILYIYQR